MFWFSYRRLCFLCGGERRCGPMFCVLSASSSSPCFWFLSLRSMCPLGAVFMCALFLRVCWWLVGSPPVLQGFLHCTIPRQRWLRTSCDAGRQLLVLAHHTTFSFCWVPSSLTACAWPGENMLLSLPLIFSAQSSWAALPSLLPSKCLKWGWALCSVHPWHHGAHFRPPELIPCCCSAPRHGAALCAPTAQPFDWGWYTGTPLRATPSLRDRLFLLEHLSVGLEAELPPPPHHQEEREHSYSLKTRNFPPFPKICLSYGKTEGRWDNEGNSQGRKDREAVFFFAEYLTYESAS